jgi:tRNA modification GTPase
VGIVRLSGKEAFSIACQITRKEMLSPRYAHLCKFHDGDVQTGKVIDEGLAIFFPAPHSFTGEDVVELQGHGGPVILDMLVAACLKLGAQQAGPGEFSLRAFLNDKIDLVQAEAIADMIDADTESAVRAAHHSLQGEFSDEVNQLVHALIELRVRVEASIDFPEEEIDFLSDGHVANKLQRLTRWVDNILAVARQGRLLRDGITLVLAGRPNAGKSSLLNALVGADAAIVTSQEGTTRDVLREQMQLDGIPVNLVDTAGLRDTNDMIEREGVRRARIAIESADAVLFVIDASMEQATPSGFEARLPQQYLLPENIPVIWLLNKADLSGVPVGRQTDHSSNTVFSISAKEKKGLDELKRHIKMLAGWRDDQTSVFSARRRHLNALQKAHENLQKGEDNLHHHRAGELLAEDLRAAQQALEEITGVFTADDLLGKIFGSFCIGK